MCWICFVFVYGDALFDIAAKVTTSQTFEIAYEMSRGAYIICSFALSIAYFLIVCCVRVCAPVYVCEYAIKGTAVHIDNA